MASEDLPTYELDEYCRVRTFVVKRLLYELTLFRTEGT
jgi:hypothetical protein